VVRDRKIRTALRTNQIAGFITIPSWEKMKLCNVIFTGFELMM